jgi:[protein-PII] uridylyltransferase
MPQPAETARPATPPPSMSYARQRGDLLSAGLRGAKLRGALAEAADAWLTGLLAPEPGLALVAVGGYGRAQLSPGSDLDVILLHDGSRSGAAIAAIADAVWYPIWDDKTKLDHSVRTPKQAREVARADLPAALGLLTARHVAGDATLTDRLRAEVLADWRAHAARRLPEVKAARDQRLALHGELAYRLEGDLKEAAGGLRDAYALTAISASWLADVPHGAPDDARDRLLDVRDALHIQLTARSGGRVSDRLLLQDQDEVAAALGLPGADALLAEVADAARTIAYATDVAWRRVGQVIAEQGRSRFSRNRAAERTPLADGVVAASGEAALALAADPARDPGLVLRAAAAAAQAGLPLAPDALRRLHTDGGELDTPWPARAREEFVRLLGAGPALIPVWESLDRTGLLGRLLPEWERVRSLPQRNALHTHTVDRHMVQTAVHAAARARRVDRPDLLLVAAICHDLGKGLPGDHSEVGAEIVARLLPRLGFGAPDTAVVTALVRHHLLLAHLAVHRDPQDPATVAALLDAADSAAGPDTAAAVAPDQFIALLHALTEADSEATGPAVWNRWRAGMITGLAERARAALRGTPAAPAPGFDAALLATRAAASPDRLALLALAPGGAGVARLDVAVPDGIGALALIAGVLRLRRIRVLAAEAESVVLDPAAVDPAAADVAPAPGPGEPPIADPATARGGTEINAGDTRPTGGDLWLSGRAARDQVRHWAVQRWTVAAEFGTLPDVARLRTDLRAALAGSLDLEARTAAREAEHAAGARSGPPVAPPEVALPVEASSLATVLEVRAHDTPGLLYRVTAAIARASADIVSARIATLGAEAVDVFYLTGPDGEPLVPEHAAVVVAEVRSALAPAAPGPDADGARTSEGA